MATFTVSRDRPNLNYIAFIEQLWNSGLMTWLVITIKFIILKNYQKISDYTQYNKHTFCCIEIAFLDYFAVSSTTEAKKVAPQADTQYNKNTFYCTVTSDCSSLNTLYIYSVCRTCYQSAYFTAQYTIFSAVSHHLTATWFQTIIME